MNSCARWFWLPVAVASLLWVWAPVASAHVTIDWVGLGDPGNAADNTGYGAVAYRYRISKYETTNAQYAEFLNAVAATDTHGLYNPLAWSYGNAGIIRRGSPGSYTYTVFIGNEDLPVNYVSWYDSLRFANWLHNGQPTGGGDSTTTEDGAYTFSGATSVGPRNAGARVFLPTQDEWYKAAYYDPISAVYFDYPAGSNTQTSCTTPAPNVNRANCDGAVAELTAVGNYTGSWSPNGTYDQGGNVAEWNETLPWVGVGVRGGDWASGPNVLAASEWHASNPWGENDAFGFRVASPPVAALVVPSLSPVGMTLLWVMLGASGLRRLRA